MSHHIFIKGIILTVAEKDVDKSCKRDFKLQKPFLNSSSSCGSILITIFIKSFVLAFVLVLACFNVLQNEINSYNINTYLVQQSTICCHAILIKTCK